jgi:hypothetical protein
MRGATLAIAVSVSMLGGCARGSVAASDDAGGAPRADAAVRIDARPGTPDAPPLPDAPPPPPPDAPPPPPPPDACIPVTTQLLANPELDWEPVGTSWGQQIIKPGYPLVTSQDNLVAPAEHSAPYKAWLGGFAGSAVTDVLYQDVAIPAATSRLVLTGFYAVRTDETSGTTYDTATVSLTQTGGAWIATALSLSNLTPQVGWAQFGYTFPQGLSGQQLRVRFSSTNDGARPTSFFFDTLALTATHGCP